MTRHRWSPPVGMVCRGQAAHVLGRLREGDDPERYRLWWRSLPACPPYLDEFHASPTLLAELREYFATDE